MFKHKINQKLQQKISPQQIKLMKLIQLPTIAFEERIRYEIEKNPVLELEELNFKKKYQSDFLNKKKKENQSIIENYKLNYFEKNDNKKNYFEKKINFLEKSNISFYEYLKNQISPILLENKKKFLIIDFIIGNINENGFLKRNLNSIKKDIFIIFGIDISVKKIEYLLLKYIQKLDPIGIGSRNIKEYILIQLKNKFPKSYDVFLSIKIIENYFQDFFKKRFKKIKNKINITEIQIKKVIKIIKKLYYKPILGYSDINNNLEKIIPDFILRIIKGKIRLYLNNRNIPELRISSLYFKILKSYKFSNKYSNIEKKNTISFIKSKINSAKLFIESLKQRNNTLLLTMNSIINFQKKYFLTGNEKKIKPMILKDISKKIGLDISIISRVANSKYINTPYGTFLIKRFFSEGIINKNGKIISSIEIKKILKESIKMENKKMPFTDKELVKILYKKGYILARRTICKYREQLNIPVSRIRKIY